jgi:hypothetical protein
MFLVLFQLIMHSSLVKMRQCRGPMGEFMRTQFSADYIISTLGFDLRQRQERKTRKCTFCGITAKVKFEHELTRASMSEGAWPFLRRRPLLN